MVRYAKLSLPFELTALQRELTSHEQDWKAHFNTVHYEGSWTVLALRSPSGDHENIIPELMGNGEYRDTAYMQHFPSAKKLLSSINCPVMAVRFLNLQAGAIIKPHRDSELAFEKGEARLHFPVFTNAGVEFFVEDDRVPFQAGDCWYINANLLHRVSNLGAADRIHLVVDCKVNDWLGDLINSSTAISHKEEKEDPKILAAMIRQFRLMNTETSNRMADNLELKLRNNS